MTVHASRRTMLLTGLFIAWPVLAAAQQRPDIVINHGRVIDPESGLEALRSIGIRNGRIEVISTTPLEGRDTIDARNLVVAPGFIDLHMHWHASASYDFLALDGVTTAVDLEGGVFPVDPWYAARTGRARIHFGASVSHGAVRRRVLEDTVSTAHSLQAARTAQDSLVATQPGAYRTATLAEIRQIESLLDQGIAAGGLGIGFGLAYTPGASREEIYRLLASGPAAE